MQEQEQSGQEATSWYMAMLWALSFGLVGGHRFYAGRIATASIQLVLHLSGWLAWIVGQTKRFTGSDALQFLFWIKLLLWASVLWLVIDIGLLLAGRFRDKDGEPLKRQSGDLRNVSIGVGLAILSVYSAKYILPGFVKAQLIPASFGSQGSIYMSSIYTLWMFLLCTVALYLPYVWQHRRLPLSMATAQVVGVFSLALWGLVGSHFELIATNSAMQSVAAEHAHRLLMDYLRIAMLPQSFAYLLLGISLPVIALVWTMLNIRHTPRQWGRGGIGLLLIAGVVGATWLWCQPIRQHFLQLASTVIGLLALVLALIPARQEDETPQDAASNALPVLLIAFVLVGILASGLFSDMRFFDEWLRSVYKGKDADSAHLLALWYPHLWRLLYLSLAGSALLGGWFFLSGSSRQRSGKTVALLTGCLVCTIALLLWRSNINKSMVRPVLTASTTQTKSTTAAQHHSRAAIPWTAALQQKTNAPPLRVETLHHLLFVTANAQKPFGTTTIDIDNKQISLNSRKLKTPSPTATTKPTHRHPYLMPSFQKELAYVAQRRKKIAKFNKMVKFVGKVELHVSPETPFQTLASALYSAHKAGFDQPALHLVQRKTIIYGKQSVTIATPRHRFPISLALTSPLTGKVLHKPHKAPERFLLELVLDAKGAHLYQAEPPTKAAAPSSQVAAPKPRGSDKSGTAPLPPQSPKRKALWQEARKPHLTMAGLQEALRSHWKTKPPGQHLVLLRCAPKTPYYETLGAIDAIATVQRTHGKPMVWFAPTSAHEVGWAR